MRPISHIQPVSRAVVAFALTVGSAASGCNWSALWGQDAPRPALDSNDDFRVVPRCPELIVDPSALATVPTYVTLSGRRRDSGLGAEGVPVTVTLGQCDTQDAGTPDAEPIDAAVGDADAGDEATGGCGAGLPLLDEAVGKLELIGTAERGCRQRSPSELDCTLNARGEASFEVSGVFPNDEVSLGGYLPICVAPVSWIERRTAATSRDVARVPSLARPSSRSRWGAPTDTTSPTPWSALRQPVNVGLAIARDVPRGL